MIPQPVEIKQSGGNYQLTTTSTIGFDNQESRKIAEMLAQKLNVATGFSIKAQQSGQVGIQFNLNKVPVGQLGKEGYTLVSAPKGVVITANEPAGLFYGMQTLLQLFQKKLKVKSTVKANWTIPAVKITDYPRFGWRGLMLDVSRNFFSKEDVKLYIDQIARYKYNTFHWHLTDDNGWRIEIKSFPKLTEVGAWRVPRYGQFGERAAPKPGEAATDGGFYTQADIKEIINMHRTGMLLLSPKLMFPDIAWQQLPHILNFAAQKIQNTKVNPGSSFSEWYNDGTFKMLIDNTLNPSDEKVYEFLDKVFTEIAALFQIHIFMWAVMNAIKVSGQKMRDARL